MLYHIHCKVCDEEADIISDEFPKVCPNTKCNCENVNELEITEISSEQSNTQLQQGKRKVRNIILTYQTTLEEIIIPVHENGKIIIGRQGYGQEVLEKILNDNNEPVISRIHCSISFVNGEYLINDEKSLNGTYLGYSKIDCRTVPNQKLKEDEFLWLGRELFSIKFDYDTSTQNRENSTEQAMENIVDDTGETEVRGYRYKCTNCGSEFETRPESNVCPNCNSFNRISEFTI